MSPVAWAAAQDVRAAERAAKLDMASSVNVRLRALLEGRGIDQELVEQITVEVLIATGLPELMPTEPADIH